VNNRALNMSVSMMKDSGLSLRNERPSDRVSYEHLQGYNGARLGNFLAELNDKEAELKSQQQSEQVSS